MNNKPLWKECIEAFGGYESAKKAVEVADTHGLKTFNVEAMRSHLLEYRREHGIYEINDKIIRLDNDSHYIYSISKIENDLITFTRKKKTKTWGFWLGINEIRHATALEIQEGHRLP